MNHVAIMGRLKDTPELRTTTGGTAVLNFIVAVNRPPEKGEWIADFIPCVAWGHTGVFISSHFQKGDMIGLEGRMESRNYEDKAGVPRTAIELNISQVHFPGNRREMSECRRSRQAGSEDVET